MKTPDQNNFKLGTVVVLDTAAIDLGFNQSGAHGHYFETVAKPFIIIRTQWDVPTEVQFFLPPPMTHMGTLNSPAYFIDHIRLADFPLSALTLPVG